MNLISWLVQRHFGIPSERFTDKIISAIALFTTIKDYDPEDYKEILWIRENTHKDIMVPLYVLDRNVNPTKGDFKVVNHRFKFRRNDHHKREENRQDPDITVTDDRIQYYMCLAIERIEHLICLNIRDFGEEFKITMGSDDEKGDKLELT